MKAVIVANGIPADPVADRKHVSPDAFIIAADGGADYCRQLDLVPDVIIGDMDSIAKDTAASRFKDVERICHPTRKDATDLELAIQLALERDARSLVILGGLGGRWDMSLGNLLLLARPELKAIPAKIIDGRQEIILLKGPQTATLEGKPGDTLSLIPLGIDAAGVSLTGLEYPLTNATLVRGSSRGISNVLTGASTTVEIESGAVVCVLIRQTT